MRYRYNRHNAGFLFLDWFGPRVRQGPVRAETGLFAHVGEGELAGRPLLLVRPQTWMNLSGQCYAAVLAALGYPVERTLVVYDDLALPFGAFRVRGQGSSGGHRGMESILAAAGRTDIPRLRIGIGGEAPPEDTVHYVLSDFTPSESGQLPELFTRLAEVVAVWAEDGIRAAMDRAGTLRGESRRGPRDSAGTAVRKGRPRSGTPADPGGFPEENSPGTGSEPAAPPPESTDMP
ncbi:MAG: aminoacyl-tRNA hydrolase [Acidobacteria bacterium]|nr:aminoacyl-tRNA hydrolase [Acidobacteriota bacterium]